MTTIQLVAAGFALATILACAFAALLAALVLIDEIRRLVERCDAETLDGARRLARDSEAVIQQYERERGLRLCPRDEVADRRAMREDGRVA